MKDNLKLNYFLSFIFYIFILIFFMYFNIESSFADTILPEVPEVQNGPKLPFESKVQINSEEMETYPLQFKDLVQPQFHYTLSNPSTKLSSQLWEDILTMRTRGNSAVIKTPEFNLTVEVKIVSVPEESYLRFVTRHALNFVGYCAIGAVLLVTFSRP